MKFTTKQPRLSVPLRPMICSIASALSLFSLEAHAQFASTPLYLQNDSSSAGQLGVKHNIMLFIDDSGSMKWIPGEKRPPRYYQKRIEQGFGQIPRPVQLEPADAAQQRPYGHGGF